MMLPDTWWGMLLSYVIVFASGGLLCLIAEILVIKTKLTPARILVIFLIAGIVLYTIGLYEPLYGIMQSGIAVPIVGFGAALAKGTIEFVTQFGPLGAFAGGIASTAYGVGAAIVASYLVTLIFNAKTK